MSLTLQQKVASFQISYSLAVVAQLKEKERPKTAIWNKLDQLEDYLGRTLDYYRVQHFRKCDLDRAVSLFDRLDGHIAEIYPTTRRKRQNRRQKRNQCRIERPVRRAHR